MNAEERAEYIVNSLKNSIPLIAEEIRTAQREAMGKCKDMIERLYREDESPDANRERRSAANALLDAVDGIRALIAQLEEEQ